MDKTKKRVDIRLKPNKIVRGMAEIREDGVSITYKKIFYVIFRIALIAKDVNMLIHYS